jgi:tRNA(Ile)-lysidine synthase
MRAVAPRDGLLHARPLLGVSKAALVALCQDRNWPFVQDPSNADERFARARWRRLMPQLAQEGLDAGRLARLAERAARAEDALDAKAREALARSAPFRDGAAIGLDAKVLADEPFEIALRVLTLALAPIRTREHLRLHRIEACLGRMRGALARGEPMRATVAGAVLGLDREGRLRIAPEPSRRRGRSPDVRMNAAGAPHSLGKGGRHA